MSPRRGPAYEEQAELTILRDQADRSAAEAARTLPVMLAAGVLVYWRKRHTAFP